jgi:HEAT repeat protein
MKADSTLQVREIWAGSVSFMTRHSGMALLLTLCCSPAIASEQVSMRTTSMNKDIEVLISGSVADQQRAMLALKRAGKSAIPLLLQTLRAPHDYKAKLRVGATLESILSVPDNQDSATLQDLKMLAASRKYSDVSPVIACISAFKDDVNARQLLREIAQSHPDDSIRARALSGLVANSGNDRNEAPILQRILSSDPSLDVKLAAARELALLGDGSGRRIILEALSQSPNDIRAQKRQMQAAITAGRIGSLEFVPILERVSKDPKAYMVWKDAAEALFEIRVQHSPSQAETFAILREGLRHRLAAEWAANRLSGLADTTAQSILQEAANDESHPGRDTARRYLK